MVSFDKGHPKVLQLPISKSSDWDPACECVQLDMAKYINEQYVCKSITNAFLYMQTTQIV